jgi:hypothetical protein
MHYKNRANVYKVIGRGVLVVVVVVHICSYLWGEGVSHVGNASVVALVFGFGMDSCQISVILNHCIKTRFFGGLYKLQCSCGRYRALLTDSVGMLVSWIGDGSGGGGLPSLCSASSLLPGW